MTATKQWPCHRCGGTIQAGELFDIRNGEFLCENCATMPEMPVSEILPDNSNNNNNRMAIAV